MFCSFPRQSYTNIFKNKKFVLPKSKKSTNFAPDVFINTR